MCLVTTIGRIQFVHKSMQDLNSLRPTILIKFVSKIKIIKNALNFTLKLVLNQTCVLPCFELF